MVAGGGYSNYKVYPPEKLLEGGFGKVIVTKRQDLESLSGMLEEFDVSRYVIDEGYIESGGFNQRLKVLIVAYDNDSWISYFPLGPAYVAAAVRNAGHEVVFYNQDVYHWPDEHLTAYLSANRFDAVGMGACGGYYQYKKILALCEAVNKVPADIRPFLWLGGHLVSPEPEHFLKKAKADAICIGEGEVTTVELLETVMGNRSLESVNGIAFLRDNNLIVTPPRELIEDIDKISYPVYDLLPMEHYVLTPFDAQNKKRSQRSIAIVSSRGCNFKCNFCYRMDKGIRLRSVQSVLDEMKFLIDKYYVSYFSFEDELFMSSIERVHEMCEGIQSLGMEINWRCTGRLNYAASDGGREMLDVMKNAGCVYIGYGVESVNDEILKNMNKNLTVEQIIKGVENTIAAGISPGIYMIFGNIGENVETLENSTQFLLKYDDHTEVRTIRALTPYPGSPLYDYAVKEGMLSDCEDFYKKNKNTDLLTVNFTDLSDEEYYKALHNANARLLEKHCEEKMKQYMDTLNNLYFKKNANFRGFRAI